LQSALIELVPIELKNLMEIKDFDITKIESKPWYCSNKLKLFTIKTEDITYILQLAIQLDNLDSKCCFETKELHNLYGSSVYTVKPLQLILNHLMDTLMKLLYTHWAMIHVSLVANFGAIKFASS